MRSKLSIIALSTATAVLWAGCAPSVPEEDNTAGGDEPTTENGGGEVLEIAFVTHTNDITDLFGQMQIGFTRALDEAGIEYNLTQGAPPNSDGHEAMDRILTDLQAVNPDYLMFSPTSLEINEPRLVDLENAGVKIIMQDVMPPGESAIDPLTWVVYSHDEMGYIAGSDVARQHCETGDDNVEVTLFWGPVASEVSQERGKGILRGMEEVFAECGQEWEIVEEVFADFNREKAYNLMETVATAHPNQDIAVGFNSNTALGMSEALITSNRLEGVSIVTMGGQPNELAALCNGEINNSVFRNPWDMGRLGAAAIIADINGEADALEEIEFTSLESITSCEDTFSRVPGPILEQEEFRGGLAEGTWEEFEGLLQN